MSQTTNVFRLAASIDRGIALLNDKRPGWQDGIDIGRLAMNSFRDCVLGQIYGDYEYGFNTLELNFGEAETLGFAINRDVENAWKIESTTLTHLWREAIIKLRFPEKYVVNERLHNHE